MPQILMQVWENFLGIKITMTDEFGYNSCVINEVKKADDEQKWPENRVLINKSSLSD